MKEVTAIIKKLVIGKVDGYKGIVGSATMDMDGLGCILTFTMDELKKMMEDAEVYNDVQGLVGKPCQVIAEWGESCGFVRMWKG